MVKVINSRQKENKPDGIAALHDKRTGMHDKRLIMMVSPSDP